MVSQHRYYRGKERERERVTKGYTCRRRTIMGDVGRNFEGDEGTRRRTRAIHSAKVHILMLQRLASFHSFRNQLRSAAGNGYAAQARINRPFPLPPPPPLAGQSPPDHHQLAPVNLSYKSPAPNERYKTRLCRDVAAGRFCPRGQRCTYAHSLEEMRQAQHFARHQPRLALRPPMPQNGWDLVFCLCVYESI